MLPLFGERDVTTAAVWSRRPHSGLRRPIGVAAVAGTSKCLRGSWQDLDRNRQLPATIRSMPLFRISQADRRN